MAGQTLWLQRPSADEPWGFRLEGGRDYHAPLSVQKVTSGSVASIGGLESGDVILRFGDTDTSALTYSQAMDVIKNSGNMLQIVVSKQGDQYNSTPQVPPSAQQSHAPTRLEQQLSNMSVSGGSDSYGRQNSYPAPPPPPQPSAYQPQSYSQSHPPGAPSVGPSYNYGGPTSYGGGPTYTPQSPSSATPHTPKAMPDAVLNMAAKGEPDKKPWAYAPDMDVIKEQRDKVRKRAPHGGMPKYQQLLNMPQFDDGPVVQSPSTPPANPYGPGPGEVNVAHLQYNSPLQMYSGENVREAFAGQTDGVVTGVQGVNKDGGQDLTKSPVYRMIHGLDESKPRPRPPPPEAGTQIRVTRAPAEDDEVKFSGIGSRSDIPSKSFQRLQSLTGGSEIDTTSIRGNVSGGDALEPQIGDYDQASIRYTGRNIPSKSFRMLQSMTGPEPPMQAGPPRRQRQKMPQSPDEPNPDDIVDISYVGGNIPSRSFKVLQQAMGQPEEPVVAQQPTPYASRDSQNNGASQGRTVKVIKLRTQQNDNSQPPSGVTDF